MSAPKDPSSREAGELIVAGFMPLTDCAVLVAAREKGFAAAEDLDLVLVREASWANIRDRMAIGHFDVAHMLAPMVLAANLGLSPLRAPLMAPMALGKGGNVIAVSRDLHARMKAMAAPDNGDPRLTAEALAKALGTGSKPPVFAIVHPFSSHHYELAMWLASAGLDIHRDIEVTALPPSYMADALAAGQIDGFCAGEPWGSVAAAEGSGQIVTTSPSLWRAAPGKVLGVREEFAEQRFAPLERLLKALWRSAQWCDDAANRNELASILARPDYLAQPVEVVSATLCKAVPQNVLADPNPGAVFGFSREGASYPLPGHALWFYAQMVLAGQVAFSVEHLPIVAGSYRPDLYATALAGLAPAPGKISQILGGPDDAFFDGRRFDPNDLASYLRDKVGFA